MKKKLVKLTENDLVRIIEKVVKENKESELEELVTLDLGDDFEDDEEYDLADSPWDTKDVLKAKMARELRKSHDYLPDEYEFEDDVYISEIKKLKKRISVMEKVVKENKKTSLNELGPMSLALGAGAAYFILKYLKHYINSPVVRKWYRDTNEFEKSIKLSRILLDDIKNHSEHMEGYNHAEVVEFFFRELVPKVESGEFENVYELIEKLDEYVTGKGFDSGTTGFISKGLKKRKSSDV